MMSSHRDRRCAFIRTYANPPHYDNNREKETSGEKKELKMETNEEEHADQDGRGQTHHRLIQHRRSTRYIGSTRRRRTASRTTFARIAAEFLVSWTFRFPHLVLCDALIVELTVSLDIRMDAIPFVHA